ncbi:MAG: hypothetical protein ACON4G_00055 [Candidatus Puniceispirillaceae bacterium]
MSKLKSKSFLIGAGLAGATILVAGLAVAAVKTHDHHHGERGHNKHGHKMMKLHKLDTNDDDLLSLAEFTAPLSAQFLNLDTNKDGQISEDEFLAKATMRFAKLDTDSNGTIDEAEMPKRQKGKKGHGKKGGYHHDDAETDNSTAS